AAKFALEPGDPVAIGAAVAQYSAHRRLTQPVGASAGSMFKNPPSGPAGWYVQQAGLRGLQVGQAQVSELHGNLFINRGGATAADVLALVAQVQSVVYDRFAVELELEIQVIGEEARARAAVG
ncbi:MAG: hypothetical protein NZ518_10305, partial [Dehalococcoidia bacterium]|nr:hypothetical protein [Dehalococcoidia bacterium]